MMKILIITNKVPFPPRDGGSIATSTLAKAFATQGHTVEILSINTLKHFFDPETHGNEVPENIVLHTVPTDTTPRPAQALRNFLFSRLPYNAVRFISEKFEKKLIELLKNKQFDIIQIEGLYMLPYVPAMRKFSKAPVAYRAHNIEHQVWKRVAANTTAFFKQKYLANLARRIFNFETTLLNTYDLLVPITPRDAKVLRQMGSMTPLHVAPAGIDFQSAQDFSAEKVEFPSLFHLGALDWAPNQEGLLWFFENCWKAISSHFPKLKFYVAGRNAPDWFVKKMDYPNVEYCGEVENAYQFMASKALMIVPLLSGSGMRVKIIEGMALQKTIITTSIGTEGIKTTDGENILIANTPLEFSEKIAKILLDRRLFDQIGLNALNFVRQNFDNQRIAQKLLDFYQKSKTKL